MLQTHANLGKTQDSPLVVKFIPHDPSDTHPVSALRFEATARHWEHAKLEPASPCNLAICKHPTACRARRGSVLKAVFRKCTYGYPRAKKGGLSGGTGGRGWQRRTSRCQYRHHGCDILNRPTCDKVVMAMIMMVIMMIMMATTVATMVLTTTTVAATMAVVVVVTIPSFDCTPRRGRSDWSAPSARP